MRAKAFAILMVALLTVSCSLAAKPRMEVTEGWAEEAKVSEISAGDLNNSCICDIKSAAQATNAFMNIQNHSAEADRLLKAESSDITRIEFRRTNLGGSVTFLDPVESIDLPANGQISFSHGNYAMILMGMKRDLKPGETLKVSLFFEKAGQVDVSLEIRAK